LEKSVRINSEQISGVFAIMPTPATDEASDPATLNTVDFEEARRAASALVSDGVDAIMLNGTFGEGATLTWEEHREFTRTVVEEVNGRVPVLGGATTLNTRETIFRAQELSDIGVDGILLGRPMWSPCDDATIASFYAHVAANVPDLGIVVYDNPVSFRGKISPWVYSQLAKIPQVIAAKYPALGESFLKDLEAMGEGMKLLPLERQWYQASTQAPGQIDACWSGSASCGPAAAVALRDALASGNDQEASRIADELGYASETFFPEGSFELFSRYNVPLEKIRIDEAGYLKAGPCRPPYIHCPEEYAEGARESGRRLAKLHAELKALRKAQV
jgi:4-(2-carboxyphenyl)-2-oxobut-3-enoate aldolase